MSARAEAELPHHFGPQGELFGVYHAVATAAAKAVLLCPPLGQEQARSHRLYRQLAHALAADGIPALRFDYFGSGDSAGESGERDWNRCLADATTAAAELRRLSGCAQVVGFGARVGGSVALEVVEAASFSELILWDPVLDGAAMVARLDALQRALQQDRRRFLKPRSAHDAVGQWCGFAVSAPFRQQLLGLRPGPPRCRSLLLDSCTSTAGHPWADAAMMATVELLRMPQATPWEDLDRLEIAILSHELIRTVGNRLKEPR